jgi:hypothetical protein
MFCMAQFHSVALGRLRSSASKRLMPTSKANHGFPPTRVAGRVRRENFVEEIVERSVAGPPGSAFSPEGPEYPNRAPFSVLGAHDVSDDKLVT